MSLLHLYLRVLEMLGPERRLGLVLACANVLLAASQFADPVLFGRIVDALARNDTGPQPLSSNVTVLIAAWVGFGLFTIICGVLVALHADRIAHRRRQAAITDFFDHVLQLPLSFHTTSHSGRLMKVMLSGTDALWVLWLDFFRDSFAAGVSLLVLLPLSLFLNWQLGLLLIAVCVIFAFLTGLVISKTETLQRTVERHYSDLAERASDALGNVALVQGFARVEAEVSGLRELADKLLSAQLPVLNWWAVVAVLTRASTTLTMLAILIAGVALHSRGRASIGDIVMFMSFSASLIGQLEKFVRFISKVFMDAPRLREFFNVLDTESSVRDRPDAVDPGRLRGLVEFKDVTLSYDGKRPAVADLTFTALPGDVVALVGSTGAGKSTALALLHRAFDPQSGTVMIDGVNVRDMKLSASAAISASYSRKRCCSTARSPTICASASPTRPWKRCATPRRAPRRSNSSSGLPRGSTRSWASAAACCPAASVSASRSRAPFSRTRRSSFSTRRRARSMPRPKSRCRRHSTRSCRTGPPS